MQYHAQFDCRGVQVSFSTVEVDSSDIRIGECIGRLTVGAFRPRRRRGPPPSARASELRLISEVIRGRPERIDLIDDNLSRTGYDEELFVAALARLGPVARRFIHPAVRERTVRE